MTPWPKASFPHKLRCDSLDQTTRRLNTTHTFLDKRSHVYPLLSQQTQPRFPLLFDQRSPSDPLASRQWLHNADGERTLGFPQLASSEPDQARLEREQWKWSNAWWVQSLPITRASFTTFLSRTQTRPDSREETGISPVSIHIQRCSQSRVPGPSQHFQPGPEPREGGAVQPLRRLTVVAFTGCSRMAYHAGTNYHLAEQQMVRSRPGASSLALGQTWPDQHDSNHASKHLPKHLQTWHLPGCQRLLTKVC